MAVESNLALHTLVAPKRDFEFQEGSQVVHQVLERAAILVASSAQTLLHIIANLTNFPDILGQEVSKPLSGRLVSWCVIQRTHEGEYLIKTDARITENGPFIPRSSAGG